MQKRRTLYANFLTTLDRLGYLTLHATGHPGDEEETHDATQDWIESHNRLTNIITEIRLIGSDEFVGIAEDTWDFWAYWIGPVLDADPHATRAWHEDLPEGTDEDSPLQAVKILTIRATLQARAELSQGKVESDGEPEWLRSERS